MHNYPLSGDDKLTGKVGDYWLENGQVKYREAEWQDVSPPGSLYISRERVITVKVLIDPPEALLRRLMAR